MAEVKWIKLNVDMFDHHKIRYLRRLPEGNSIVLVWIMLLTLAGRCNSGGMIFLTENIPYTPKMLADELDFRENTVCLALAQLEALGMIHSDEQFFVVTNWNKYQSLDRNSDMREYNRLAKQRSRGRQRSLADVNEGSAEVRGSVNGSSDEQVNDLSMTVNDRVNDEGLNCQPCQNTEERREKEEEREEESKREEEEEKNRDIQSIIHSREEAKRSFLGGKLGQGVVLLSEDQIDDLLDKLSVEEFDKYVSVVAGSELKGHHYKKRTHYVAILEMAAKDRRTL